MTEQVTPECYVSGQRFYLYRFAHYEEEEWYLHPRCMNKQELAALLIEHARALIDERDKWTADGVARFGCDVADLKYSLELTPEQDEWLTHWFRLGFDSSQRIAERAGFTPLQPQCGCFMTDHSHEGNMEDLEKLLGD